MPRNYKMHVWEVQRAAQAILQFADGKTFDDYRSDWVLRSAVERQIGKIGGAAAKLAVNDDPIARRVGSSAGAIGNGYNDPRPKLDEEGIWNFIQNNLEPLHAETTAILEQDSETQPLRAPADQRTIVPIVAQRENEIRNLCRLHHVKRLDVFGSAVNGDFHTDESDIDFLVEFEESAEGQDFGTRFQLSKELEALFGRSIDLVDDAAIENPYFRQEVDQTRQPIYAP